MNNGKSLDRNRRNAGIFANSRRAEESTVECACACTGDRYVRCAGQRRCVAG